MPYAPLLDNEDDTKPSGGVSNPRDRINSGTSSQTPNFHHVEAHETHQSKGKIVFVVILFVISLISFVSQTELTALVYTTGFNDPVLLLYLTHSSWWAMWPLQVLSIAVFKTARKYLGYNYTDKSKQYKWRSWRYHFGESVKNQHRNIYSTLEIVADVNDANYVAKSAPTSVVSFLSSPPMWYMYKTCLIVVVVLNVAGSTWYVAMNMSYASDVTAIYNCSAFAAYAFAVPMLGEKFSLLKLSSVVVAVVGVFIVAYSGNDVSGAEDPHPLRLWGNLLILSGAILYGYYEVIYKKWCCPPSTMVSSKRQASLSSFTASILGVFTSVLFGLIIMFVHLSGLHKFHAPTSTRAWWYAVGSLFSNMVFSGSFLSLMALTSPVLSSVASLVTILLVGVVEWWLFGVTMSLGQWIGDLVVVAGFAVLTYASWNEISEEDTDDQGELTDSESVYSRRVSAFM